MCIIFSTKANNFTTSVCLKEKYPGRFINRKPGIMQQAQDSTIKEVDISLEQRDAGRTISRWTEPATPDYNFRVKTVTNYINVITTT